MKKIKSKIEGISFRIWQDDNDYIVYATMRNAYNNKLGIDRVFNTDDVKKWLEAQKGFDPKKMFVVAEFEGKPIAIQMYYQNKETNGPYIFFHVVAVDPEWIDSSVTAELFDWIENEMEVAAQTLPEDASAVGRAGCEDSEDWLFALLENKGYETTRFFFEMSRPIDALIPDRHLTDGLEIKPINTREMEIKVIKANDLAFQDHWEHTPITDELMKAWMEDSDYNPSLWIVAWNDDEIVGSVLNFIDKNENEILNRKRGYTEEITTQRAYRGKGVASALIAESIKMFRDLGMDEVALSVDTINSSGALGLYESFGYKAYKRMVAMGRKIK